MKEEKHILKEEKQTVKEEALEESSNSGGGELFPGLNISGTVAVAHQAPVKPAPKPFSLSRTVDSAWLARCGAPIPEEATPPPTSFKGLLPQPGPSSSYPSQPGPLSSNMPELGAS